MSLADQIGRWMSMRAPQLESLKRLHAIAAEVDFRKATLGQVAQAAVACAGTGKKGDPPPTLFHSLSGRSGSTCIPTANI